MQRDLYPSALMGDSLESLLADRSPRSQAIYLAVLVSAGVALALLPIIRVGVSVQAPGIIRPASARQEVAARISGFAEVVDVRENQWVTRGQILLRLRTAPVRVEEALVRSQLERTSAELHDLERLTRDGSLLALRREELRSTTYRQAFTHFTEELDEIAVREEEATRELERARALVERGLFPRMEMEQRAFALSQLQAERELRIERAISAWVSALVDARSRLHELDSRRAEVALASNLYQVEAPVTGTIEQLAGISPGSYVQAGDLIAAISPAGELRAEAYADPGDIGLLRVGMPARLLIDAFNYSDWGFIPGRITEISNDYRLIDGTPVFQVAIALDRTYLTLQNDYRGELRKGMTLRARFMITERTLWQLLRDDINDWVNPVGPA